jgi:hypothetical protein
MSLRHDAQVTVCMATLACETPRRRWPVDHPSARDLPAPERRVITRLASIRPIAKARPCPSIDRLRPPDPRPADQRHTTFARVVPRQNGSAIRRLEKRPQNPRRDARRVHTRNKQALAAATDASGAVLTAAFSIATAYGAVVALVSPKGGKTPNSVVLPFVFLAIAVVASMIGRVWGVSLDETNDIATIRSKVHGAVLAKRIFAGIAVAVLAVGVVAAGVVVSHSYGKGTTASSSSGTIFLTADGHTTIQAICGVDETSLQGIADVNGLTTNGFATIHVSKSDKADARCGPSLALPASAIGGVRSNGEK